MPTNDVPRGSVRAVTDLAGLKGGAIARADVAQFVVEQLTTATWLRRTALIRQIGRPSWVAKVGGRTIEGPETQDAYPRSLAQVARQSPPGQQPASA